MVVLRNARDNLHLYHRLENECRQERTGMQVSRVAMVILVSLITCMVAIETSKLKHC